MCLCGKYPTVKRIHTVAVVSAARGCTPFNPTTLQKRKRKKNVIHLVLLFFRGMYKSELKHTQFPVQAKRQVHHYH